MEKIAYDTFFKFCDEASSIYGHRSQNLEIGLTHYAYLAQLRAERHPKGRVLDFGCGKDKILKQLLSIDDDSYFSCDSDPSGEFSFGSVEDIPDGESFDIISMNQILEHVPFEEAIRLVSGLAAHLAVGGSLFICVPNPEHPTKQLANPTHITPWKFNALHGILRYAGLKPVKMARCLKQGLPHPRWYARPFIKYLCTVFDMDWCSFIYCVGRKETQTT